MNYLLDSNICTHFFKGKFGINIKLNELGFDKCAISEIFFAEPVFGAENSNNPEKNQKIIDQFVSHISVLPIYD
jgi:tRNA(fMet)-specific endonuclease VapC